MNRRKFLQQSAVVSSGITAFGSTKAFPKSDKKTKKLKSAKPGSPNILFIMTDQQRYDCLGANGNSIIKTPNLDKLAKQSANFNNAFVQSPVCTPSRASFFTGRYAHAHKNRVNYTELNKSETLLPKYLQDAGYQTSLVGKTHLFYNYPPTKEEAKRTGFEFIDLHDGTPNVDPFSDYYKWRQENDPMNNLHYRTLAKDVPELKKQMSKNDNPYRSAIEKDFTDTAWTGFRTRDRLKQFSKSNKPFFLFSSFWKPHSPFEVPEPYDSMYNDVDFKLPHRLTHDDILKLPPHVHKLILRNEYRGMNAPFDMEDEALQWIIRSYYGTISHIDDEVGLVLKTLEETGLAENTIVVFVSDHGDQLLEHGIVDKNVFFESSIHIPFMISYPGIIKPAGYDDLIESIDLLPTLFEIIGLEEPYNNHGQSLLPLIGNSDKDYTSKECVFSENVLPEVFLNLFNFEKGKGVMDVRHPDGKMARTKKWKYNYYPKGYEELYDLENDPDELSNLADNPEFSEAKYEMKERMIDWLITASETDQIAEKWLI